MLVWVLIVGKLKGAFNSPKSRANTLAPVLQNTIGAEESIGKHPSASPASSPTSPAQNGQTTTLEQQPVAAFPKRWWSKDPRASIAPEDLELAIAEAVRKASPGCDDFIGVIVDHKRPKMRFDPSWEVRGVKFGKADRNMVDEPLATVVKQRQREFRLADPQS